MSQRVSGESSPSPSLLRRRRIGLRLSLLMLTFYFAFTFAMAFFPHFLAIGVPFSVGFGLIIGFISAVIIFNAFYMNLAQDNRVPVQPPRQNRGAGE